MANKYLRIKDATKLLLNLSWLCLLIYILLLKFADDDLTNPHKYHYIEEAGDGLMSQIGFISQPKLYPQGYHAIPASEWPVFAMTLESKSVGDLVDFLVSFREYYLDHRLVIFSLDLSHTEKLFVRERCYCQVREVYWQRYPTHIHNLQLFSYLPLLIQESLQEFGVVFWCDVEMRFSDTRLRPELSEQARRYGLATWPRDRYPVSTFTHPSLYPHLDADASHFLFLPMIFAVPGLYINTEDLHYSVMRPWVRCALVEYCVAPRGAQAHGCHPERRPRYKYSGCHRYSHSVLNVLLGKAYNYSAPYIGTVKVYDNSLSIGASSSLAIPYISQWYR